MLRSHRGSEGRGGRKDSEIQLTTSIYLLKAPPQIPGRLSQLQGPGHNKWRLHTWSKAAAMPLPAFPDVESSYDDRQRPQALHSTLRTMWRGNPQGCLIETFLHPRVETGQGKMPFGVPNCLLRSESSIAEVQSSSHQLASSGYDCNPDAFMAS